MALEGIADDARCRVANEKSQKADRDGLQKCAAPERGNRTRDGRPEHDTHDYHPSDADRERGARRLAVCGTDRCIADIEEEHREFSHGELQFLAGMMRHP